MFFFAFGYLIFSFECVPARNCEEKQENLFEIHSCAHGFFSH